MKKTDIARHLRHSTYVLEMYDGDEKYSTGTGFAVNSEGVLLTAAHVVTGRQVTGPNPIREKDWLDPDLKILGYTKESPEVEYTPLLCGITIEMEVFRSPLVVDAAVLVPTEDYRSNSRPFLDVSSTEPSVGTEVLMAGYPDELEPPLLFERKLDRRSEPYQKSDDDIERELEKSREQLMIKSGMIGHSSDAKFTPQDDAGWELRINVFYVDNAMHSGASGGPVVNRSGEVVGLITKRAVTQVSYPDLEDPKKEVPSGSTLAITPQTAMNYVERQFERGNVERKT